MSSPGFPTGRCYCRNKSSSLRGRGVPAGGCPAAGHRNSLEGVKSQETKQTSNIVHHSHHKTLAFSSKGQCYLQIGHVERMKVGCQQLGPTWDHVRSDIKVYFNTEDECVCVV